MEPVKAGAPAVADVGIRTARVPDDSALQPGPGRLELHVALEKWPLALPLRIGDHTWDTVELLVVRLRQRGSTGAGEAAGLYSRGDTPASMLAQVEALRSRIEAGLTRQELQQLLPPGGARNALDCALWDLESKQQNRPAWQLAGLPAPRPLVTTFSCTADRPSRVAARARAYTQARAIKLRLAGDALDASRIQAVREARPDVWLGVDGNERLTRAALEQLIPVFMAAHVSLVEQPLPVGQEARLEGLRSPVPIAADESVRGRAELATLVNRFDIVTLKLDACGGLTEALAMAQAARDLGLDVRVGATFGTSLAMAPAWLLGQVSSGVDLDAPHTLGTDREPAADYSGGAILCPDELWGGAAV